MGGQRTLSQAKNPPPPPPGHQRKCNAQIFSTPLVSTRPSRLWWYSALPHSWASVCPTSAPSRPCQNQQPTGQESRNLPSGTVEFSSHPAAHPEFSSHSSCGSFGRRATKQGRPSFIPCIYLILQYRVCVCIYIYPSASSHFRLAPPNKSRRDRNGPEKRAESISECWVAEASTALEVLVLGIRARKWDGALDGLERRTYSFLPPQTARAPGFSSLLCATAELSLFSWK